MKPSRFCACAVVSKGMRESSQRQRSFSSPSSFVFVMFISVVFAIRARTLAHGEAGSPEFSLAA
jgi:hypothetical protein